MVPRTVSWAVVTASTAAPSRTAWSPSSLTTTVGRIGVRRRSSLCSNGNQQVGGAHAEATAEDDQARVDDRAHRGDAGGQQPGLLLQRRGGLDVPGAGRRHDLLRRPGPYAAGAGRSDQPLGRHLGLERPGLAGPHRPGGHRPGPRSGGSRPHPPNPLRPCGSRLRAPAPGRGRCRPRGRRSRGGAGPGRTRARPARRGSRRSRWRPGCRVRRAAAPAPRRSAGRACAEPAAPGPAPARRRRARRASRRRPRRPAPQPRPGCGGRCRPAARRARPRSYPSWARRRRPARGRPGRRPGPAPSGGRRRGRARCRRPAPGRTAARWLPRPPWVRPTSRTRPALSSRARAIETVGLDRPVSRASWAREIAPLATMASARRRALSAPRSVVVTRSVAMPVVRPIS